MGGGTKEHPISNADKITNGLQSCFSNPTGHKKVSCNKGASGVTIGYKRMWNNSRDNNHKAGLRNFSCTLLLSDFLIRGQSLGTQS